MKLWDWLTGKAADARTKLSASSLVCPLCGERYLLGQDSTIVTTRSVDADLQARGATIHGTVRAGSPAGIPPLLRRVRLQKDTPESGPLHVAGGASIIEPFAALLLIGALTTACDVTSPYETSHDAKFVHGLIERSPTLVVSVSASPTLFRHGMGGPIEAIREAVVDTDWTEQDAEIALSIAAGYPDALVATLSEIFEVVGPVEASVEVEDWSLLSTSEIAEQIESARADYGMIVRDRYGLMTGRPLIPFIQFLVPSEVDKYKFLTCSSIYSREGQNVWSFCSCGITDALESPDASFTSVHEYYPRLLAQLIREDATGTGHSDSLRDYFPEVPAGLLLVNAFEPGFSHLCGPPVAELISRRYGRPLSTPTGPSKTLK